MANRSRLLRQSSLLTQVDEWLVILRKPVASGPPFAIFLLEGNFEIAWWASDEFLKSSFGRPAIVHENVVFDLDYSGFNRGSTASQYCPSGPVRALVVEHNQPRVIRRSVVPCLCRPDPFEDSIHECSFAVNQRKRWCELLGAVIEPIDGVSEFIPAIYLAVKETRFKAPKSLTELLPATGADHPGHMQT